MTPHFTLEEFTASETAARRGLDNDLPIELRENAMATLWMLERIREHLSAHIGRPAPILITSGYRSPKVNYAVGSSSRSAHLTAEAADWHCPAVGTPIEVCRILAPHADALGIGQLINEFPGSGGWVHTQTRRPPKDINRIITVTRFGAVPGIVEAA